ncbi:MAG: SPOR domain-containing protein, partial [Oscillospiraceae bacterium]
AKAICKGICKFFNYSYKEQTQPDQTQPDQTKPDQTKPDQTKPPQNPNNLYRVQVGAFSNKDNAQKLRDELKAKGYSAYIS